MYCRSWKMARWLKFSISTSVHANKLLQQKHYSQLSHILSQAITFTYRPQHRRPQNVAIHPQPICFKLLTWWLLKSNGLNAALFWRSQNCLCMPKHYFIPHSRSLLSTAFHPSFHFSAHAYTHSVCKWEDSLQPSQSLSISFLEQPTTKK